MLYSSLFPRDLFAELDRLQRDVMQALDPSPSIRGAGRGGFPALNIGGTPRSVEIYAFAPGLDPAKIEVNIDRGVLTIEGERAAGLPDEEKSTLHVNERFAGRFRRVVSLPDDLDTDRVGASYRDGVLALSIPRRESALPRHIPVK